MKQAFAFTALAAFISTQTSAQYTQNFEGINSLSSGCTIAVNTGRTTEAAEVISGSASLFANAPSSESNFRTYSTPYLNVIDQLNEVANTTFLNVSFKYKLGAALTGLNTRTIEIGLQGLAGYKVLGKITMDGNDNHTEVVSFNHSFLVQKNVYRLVLKMGGNCGSNAARIIIDDLVVNANPYYSLGGTCNTAPVATNDVYFTSNFTTATSFTSVLANDEEPNNELLNVPFISAASPDGTVTFQSDGSFTFTPNPGFTGASTSFTYTVFDFGYDQMSDNGTVTIYFTSGSVLPVRLLSFNGTLINNKAILTWEVTNNEEGARMEVEESTDGKHFTTASVMLPKTTSGTVKYEYKETSILETTSYYRLKIVNKNNTVSYSGVVMLASSKTSGDALTLLENPVVNSLRFNYHANINAAGMVHVYDVTGKKIFSRQLTLQKGINSLSIELDKNIIPGTYLVQLMSGNENKVTRFIKQ